ncbi:MAG: 60 kDa SS-A/Ro ribonucleoprotein [Planctomycetota bacterium]|jgi:60 kDa SS-A/Ro ribonucleoprotein
MANKNLLQTIVGKLIKRPDAINEAGAPAYSLTSEQALAQLAVTGCLNGTFIAILKWKLLAMIGGHLSHQH